LLYPHVSCFCADFVLQPTKLVPPRRFPDSARMFPAFARTSFLDPQTVVTAADLQTSPAFFLLTRGLRLSSTVCCFLAQISIPKYV
jgi:hypothetical protein